MLRQRDVPTLKTVPLVQVQYLSCKDLASRASRVCARGGSEWRSLSAAGGTLRPRQARRPLPATTRSNSDARRTSDDREMLPSLNNTRGLSTKLPSVSRLELTNIQYIHIYYSLPSFLLLFNSSPRFYSIYIVSKFPQFLNLPLIL